VVGALLAWIVVRFKFRGKWLIEGLIMSPLVLPPTLVGYYLLVLLGQRGLGPLTEQFLGFRFVFSVSGAIVAAVVVALPLVFQTVQVSIAEINRDVEDAARVDGCNERSLFWYIILPLIWRGLLAAGLLGFLRALGDFGTTLMVAGNIPGRTQTLSMAVYDAVQANDINGANSLALLLTTIGFGLIFLVFWIRQRPG